jgi:hypothetical protein
MLRMVGAEAPRLAALTGRSPLSGTRPPAAARTATCRRVCGGHAYARCWLGCWDANEWDGEAVKAGYLVFQLFPMHTHDLAPVLSAAARVQLSRGAMSVII